jgi:membrane protein YdbS with pleckstrin-like domain
MKIECPRCMRSHEVGIGQQVECTCGEELSSNRSKRYLPEKELSITPKEVQTPTPKEDGDKFTFSPSIYSCPVLLFGGIFIAIYIGIPMLCMSHPIVFMLSIIPIVSAVMKTITVSYTIDGDKITVSEGILTTTKITIVKKNIKSVKTKTDLFAVLFGLTNIAFNVSGDKDDVFLRGVKKDRADKICNRFQD